MKKPKHDIGRGTFLIASSDLVDPNFRRTVVLVCEHGPKGSMGLIVNRPTDRAVRDVLSEATDISGGDGLLYLGGPVGLQGLLVLTRRASPVPGAIEILPGVFLGGEPDVVREILGETPTGGEAVRVFLGYSGWGAGQLDGELQAGGWFTRRGDPDLVFGADPARIWPDALWAMGGIYRVFSAMPQDPGLN